MISWTDSGKALGYRWLHFLAPEAFPLARVVNEAKRALENFTADPSAARDALQLARRAGVDLRDSKTGLTKVWARQAVGMNDDAQSVSVMLSPGADIMELAWDAARHGNWAYLDACVAGMRGRESERVMLANVLNHWAQGVVERCEREPLADALTESSLPLLADWIKQTHETLYAAAPENAWFDRRFVDNRQQPSALMLLMAKRVPWTIVKDLTERTAQAWRYYWLDPAERIDGASVVEAMAKHQPEEAFRWLFRSAPNVPKYDEWQPAWALQYPVMSRTGFEDLWQRPTLLAAALNERWVDAQEVIMTCRTMSSEQRRTMLAPLVNYPIDELKTLGAALKTLGQNDAGIQQSFQEHVLDVITLREHISALPVQAEGRRSLRL